MSAVACAKLYMCIQKHYKHEDGRMAPGVRGHGSVPLSHSGNVVMRTVLQHLIDIGHKTSISDLIGCSCVEEFACKITDC